jgi:nucleoid DNA-binding protein
MEFLMTKPQFIEVIATHLKITKTDAKKFVEGYAEVILATLKVEGELTIHGIVKLLVKDKPAKPERLKMNPFTKQMVMVKAKPASKKVLARPLPALKKALA